MGLAPDAIPDDYDLLTEGVVDSLAILQLIANVEEHFDIKIDFEHLEPENLTIIGPFCRYVEEKSAGNSVPENSRMRVGGPD